MRYAGHLAAADVAAVVGRVRGRRRDTRVGRAVRPRRRRGAGVRHAGRRVRPRRDRRAASTPRPAACAPAGDVERAGDGDDRGGRRSTGAACRRQAELRFSSDAMADGYESWFQTLLGARARRAPMTIVVHHPAAHPYVDEPVGPGAGGSRPSVWDVGGARHRPVCGSCTSTSGSSSARADDLASVGRRRSTRAGIALVHTVHDLDNPHLRRAGGVPPRRRRARAGGRRRDDADADGRGRRCRAPHRPCAAVIAAPARRAVRRRWRPRAAGRGARHGIYVHAGTGPAEPRRRRRRPPRARPTAPPGARARPPDRAARRRAPSCERLARRPDACSSTCGPDSTDAELWARLAAAELLAPAVPVGHPLRSPRGRPRPRHARARAGVRRVRRPGRPRPTATTRPTRVERRHRPADRRSPSSTAPREIAGVPAPCFAGRPPCAPMRVGVGDAASILWYVHDHGAGHLARARAVIPKLRTPGRRRRRSRHRRRRLLGTSTCPVVALPGDVPAPPTADHRTVAPRAGGAGAAARAAPRSSPRSRGPRLHDRRRRRVDGGHGAGPPARAPRRHRAPERAPARPGPPDRAGERRRRLGAAAPGARAARRHGDGVDDRWCFTGAFSRFDDCRRPRAPAGGGATDRGPARRHGRDDLRRRGRGAGPTAPAGWRGRHRRRQRAVVRRRGGQRRATSSASGRCSARPTSSSPAPGWGAVADAVAAGARLALVPETATVRRADDAGRARSPPPVSPSTLDRWPRAGRACERGARRRRMRLAPSTWAPYYDRQRSVRAPRR